VNAYDLAKILNAKYSHSNGLMMPLEWRNAPLEERIAVLERMRAGKTPSAAFWHGMTSGDRYRVINHLKSAGAIPVAHAAFSSRTPWPGAARVFDAPVAVDREKGWTPYPVKGRASTNGRILPWRYTRLHNTWVRSEGTPVVPIDMNDGHLHNTVELLHESHGNALMKAEAMLGALARYFPREQVVELCAALWEEIATKETIERVYPVIVALAKEVERRRAAEPKAVEEAAEIDIEAWNRLL
jgi:hypothetical protein